VKRTRANILRITSVRTLNREEKADECFALCRCDDVELRKKAGECFEFCGCDDVE
jgi:hypothetical protein